MTYKLAIAATAALAMAACNAGGGSTSSNDAASPTASGAPAASAPGASTDASASLGSTGMPRQRPGLWRMAINLAPGVPPVSQEICITEQMAADAASMTRPQGTDATCDQPEIRRDADAVTGVTRCRMNGQPLTTRFRLTGDTQSRYRMEISSDGAVPSATYTVDATYVGPCQA